MGVSLGGGGVGIRSGLESGGVGGQGCSRLRLQRSPPPPTNTVGQRQINMLFRHFCWGEKDNIVAILLWRTKTHKLSPPFCSYGKKDT